MLPRARPIQSRGFGKQPERIRLRDMDLPPTKGTGRGRIERVAVAEPVPKSEPHRNRALLDMARDRPCLLRVDGVCNGDTATTVACHSNLWIHGKAGARKADDQYSVWGCIACHRWLDQGKATFLRKEHVFMLGHLSQVLEWRRVAVDPSEPPKFRKAAQWALDLLDATPTGEAP
jgi:hypothetical protein